VAESETGLIKITEMPQYATLFPLVARICAGLASMQMPVHVAYGASLIGSSWCTCLFCGALIWRHGKGVQDLLPLSYVHNDGCIIPLAAELAAKLRESEGPAPGILESEQR